METIEEFCKKEKISFIEQAEDYVFSTKQISIMLDKRLGDKRILEIMKNIWRCL